jgi:hypothetical protein
MYLFREQDFFGIAAENLNKAHVPNQNDQQKGHSYDTADVRRVRQHGASSVLVDCQL